MTIRTTTTRKNHPRTLLAIVVVFAMAGYVGAYFVNLDAGSISYVPSSKTGKVRLVPKFVARQVASEIVFWPAYKLHGFIQPNRITYDKLQLGE